MKQFTQHINEAAIKVGGAKITNQVDDYSKFNTINELCDSVETHYIDNYKDSNKIRKILAEKKLIEPLDSKQNDNYSGAVLYKGGHLVYFFWFHKMEYLCAFLVYMHKYLEIFDYDDNLDNKWHLYFDIHGDPMTGVERKSTCWHLEYRSKDRKLEKLDKAIDEFYEELEKMDPVVGIKENSKELPNLLEIFSKLYSNEES